MANYTGKTTVNATYAVISFTDLFGTSYMVQGSQYVKQAIADGWQVIVCNRTNDEAEHIARIYRTAGIVETAPNDLGSLLTYDMTEEVEDRDSSVAEEFDLVQILWHGRVIEGVITFWDDETVEVDGFTEIPTAFFMEHATLIAKADSDCGFITEYGQYLRKLETNREIVYGIASQTQNTMELGGVA